MNLAPGRTGIYFLVRLIRLPVAFTGHVLEIFGRATLEAERLAGEGVDSVFGQRPATTLGNLVRQAEESSPSPPTTEPTKNDLGAAPAVAPITQEETTMADNNLNDDMVKLIEYSIISIERRNERIVAHATDAEGKYGTPMLYLETGRVTGDGFSNARIADYVKQHCGKDELKDLDLDSLRVYYNVVARWPQSSLKYEEKILDLEQEKVDLLRDIRGEKVASAG